MKSSGLLGSKNRQNVIILAPRYHTNMVGLTKSLSNLGYDVSILVQYKGKSEDYSLLKPTEIRPSVISRALTNVHSIFKEKHRDDHFAIATFIPSLSDLKRHFRLAKPKVAFIKCIASPLTLLSLIVSNRHGCKTICLWQVGSEQLRKKMSLRFYQFLLQKVFSVDLILTPVDQDISHYNKKMCFLPFSIDAHNFSKKHFSRGRINIISIGKFIERKDHLTLLKAFLMLKDKYPSLHLTIIGESSDDDCYSRVQQFINENKLSRGVDILLNLPNKKILKMYRAFDLFVLPSYNEPAAYSHLEAMANKLPIIVSDENGTKNYINEGYNGYIFKARDHVDLANKIEIIISDKKRTIELGENSFSLVKSNYSIESTTKLLKQILG